jgi:hypothetical protein
MGMIKFRKCIDKCRSHVDRMSVLICSNHDEYSVMKLLKRPFMHTVTDRATRRARGGPARAAGREPTVMC